MVKKYSSKDFIGFALLMVVINLCAFKIESWYLKEKYIDLLSQSCANEAHETNKLKQEINGLEMQIQDHNRLIDKLKRPVTISQGIGQKDLEKMIRQTLNYLGETNPDFIRLLLFTAQVESNLGRSFKQVRGPALGIYQMEPATEKCLWDNYLKYNKNLANKIQKLRGNNIPGVSQLQGNIIYATAMAYAHYRRYGVTLKGKITIMDLEQAHKKYYNTIKGKATKEKSLMKTVGLL